MAGTKDSNGRYQAFSLSLPADYQTNSSNPSKGTGFYLNGQVLNETTGTLQIIPPSFGTDYTALVYHTSSGATQIPALDARDWVLDYFNGIFFQQDPPSDSDENPAYVDAFLYIGDYALTRLSGSGGAPGGATTQIQFNDASAFGGSATEAGFMLSASGSVILGFSMTGATVPVGEGTLVSITFDSPTPEICFADAVMSDSQGAAITTTLGDCYSGTPGCMDDTACNYNMDATYDDGSCAFESDCFGECGGMAVVDCNDECGGSAVVDCNDDCGGSAVVDCNDDCGGAAMFDMCGSCDDDFSNDCMEDACGVWGGSETDPDNCIEDGFSLSLANVDLMGGTLDVVMNNSEPVSGFQFNINGINITAATGGSAEANAFMVSGSGTVVVGFNMTGGQLPPGNTTLVNVAFDSYDGDICLAGAILSDSFGAALDVTLGDCYTGFGCMDMSACNYDPTATDPADCIYPSEGFDCDGVSLCPLDLNSNGYVEVSDLLMILSDFGCAVDCVSDVNGDGAVTVSDVLLILSSFGDPCPVL